MLSLAVDTSEKLDDSHQVANAGQRQSASISPIGITQASPQPTPRQLRQDGSTARAKVAESQTHFLSYQSLPHEALLLVFQFLYENDVQLLEPCMRVCRAWRNLILKEPRFWHRLQVDLAYPGSALKRTSRQINRLKHGNTPAYHSSSRSDDFAVTGQSFTTSRVPLVLGKPSVKSLLDLSVLYANKRNKEFAGHLPAFQAYCRNTLSGIMNEIQPHLADLRSLNVQLIGDDQIHLEMLEDILLPQITLESSAKSKHEANSTRISNAKHVQIVMPRMHSFPISKNILAFFQSAEILTIRGNSPLPPYAEVEPEGVEELSPALDRLLRYLAQGRDVSLMLNRDKTILQQYYEHQEEMKRYNRELAEFESFWKLEDLDWSKLLHPKEFFADDSTYGDLIDVKHCHFSTLTTLNIFGCVIRNDLVLPGSGFPALRSLSVTKSKWGKGLWDFLAQTPNLEYLDLQYLEWNDGSEDKDALKHHTAPSTPKSGEDAQIPPPSVSNQLSSQSSIADEGLDEDTPPYQGPPSPASEVSGRQTEWNFILDNSIITIFGDNEYAIEDFDMDGDEDPQMTYLEIIEARMGFSKSEAYYHYPEDLCYPPDIDTGCSWSVISKPVVDGSWQSEAGFRFFHRVYTHYDDQECIDEEFYSEWDWPELQKRRAAFRKMQELEDANSDEGVDRGSSDSYTSTKATQFSGLRGKSVSHALTVPEHISLPKLQSFSFIGGLFKPIWVDTTSDLDGSVRRPAISMPAVKQISLRGDTSLESERISRPVPAVYAEALSYDEQRIRETQLAYLSHNDWHMLVQQFEIGQEPVPNEASDDMLLAEMSEDDAAYYEKQPHKLSEYRRDWRIRQGLLAKSGRAEGRALLALLTRATISSVAPFAGAALMASCTLVTSLDLSYTNVSPAVFSALLSYSGQLRKLSLAGVRTLQDKDLEALPRMCPLLSSLDISRCAPQLTPRAAILVVDRMRHSTRNVNRLSKVRLDDPARIQWGPIQLSSRHHFYSMYAYLDFLNILVDEEVEQWLAAVEKGAFFSKKAGKKRQPLMPIL